MSKLRELTLEPYILYSQDRETLHKLLTNWKSD